MASKTILVIVKKAIKAMENIVKVSKYIVIQFCIQKIFFYKAGPHSGPENLK